MTEQTGLTQPVLLSDIEESMLKAKRLEDAIKASGVALLDIPIRHYFSQGVYAREMRVPAGAVIVGEIHKHQQLNILSYGRVRVQTEKGVEVFEAPFTMVAPAGAKRVFYAETDAVWTVIHGTDKTDVEEIRAEFIAPDIPTYLEYVKQLEAKS